MMRKIIIAGGQCAGKTSVVDELSRRGYYVIPEAAMFLIEEEQKGNNAVYPWTNLLEFEKRVIKFQLAWEDNIPLDESLVFLDRSLVDCLAYMLREGKNSICDLEKKN